MVVSSFNVLIGADLDDEAGNNLTYALLDSPIFVVKTRSQSLVSLGFPQKISPSILTLLLPTIVKGTGGILSLIV